MVKPLIGHDPDQVPVNAHLLGMSRQDPNSVSISGGVVFTNQIVYAPVTGFSITIKLDAPDVILDPAGTLATGTIVMPAYAPNNAKVSVSSTAVITALTVTPGAGQTIKNAPTTLAAGSAFSYRYNESNLTWYKQSGS